jgi:predicted dehydrogenase
MVKRHSKIGFAVVGLGNIAQSSVLPAFHHSRRARLVALVSGDKKKATRLARKFHADSACSYEEYAACLANPAVNAVYIATPQGLHEPFAAEAAAAGKHVLCEKPLAATVEQASRIIAACRKHGVLLMTAYRKFFEPSTVYLKKLIHDHALGRIDVIHTAFSELNGTTTSPAWLRDEKLAGGGPLMDLGVYCVNTSRWLVDEDPVTVSAEAWKHDASRFREVEEGVAFRMNFPSGLVVQGSSTYSSAMSSFLNVQGSQGWALLSPAFTFEHARNLVGNVSGRSIRRTFKIVDEFAPQLDAFATAIQTGGAVEADGIQGLRDLSIIAAIYEAAKNQTTVRVKYDHSEKSASVT